VPVAEARPKSAAEAHLTELCELIAQRLDLMLGVAQAKWNRELPITDEKREQALLTKLAADGKELHLPAEFVTDFFRAQITAAKQVQEQSFQEWTAQQHPPFIDPPDLEKVVRPKIDEINRQLLVTLAKLWAERSEPDWAAAVDRATKAAFQSTAWKWNEDVIATATKPLRNVAESKK
ncbi:MAG: aroQ, partial [Planctomycetaceae bacterium]|nr:aroQ [Planctomycetaceae bacterium]